MTKNIPFAHIFPGILLLLFSGMSVSCKKLIQISATPSGAVTTTQAFGDSADIMSSVVGVYSYLQSSAYEFQLEEYMGCASDELTASYNVSYPPGYAAYYNNSIISTDAQAEQFWVKAYGSQAIYQINACLAGINGNGAISSSLNQQLTGELKVLRALYYFQLVNLFGGVPLVSTTAYNTNEALPRASVDSVYGFIQSDLTSASQLLTPSYPSSGHIRPNQYVAWALQAKAYLYTGQWAAAANTASAVINSGQYSLVQNLNNIFLDGSSEAIWQLPPLSTSAQTQEGANFVPYNNIYVPNLSIAPFLMNAFEAGDGRLTNWVGICTVNVNGTNVNYYYPYKYKNRTLTATTQEDNMIFRLGELYLIRAEALAHQSGKLDSALADLNQIRLRAGLSPSAAVSQTDALNAIAHERQVELFTEWGYRWFDLARTGTINTVLGAEKPAWKSTQSLLPIPLTEMQLNPALTQNLGY